MDPFTLAILLGLGGGAFLLTRRRSAESEAESGSESGTGSGTGPRFRTRTIGGVRRPTNRTSDLRGLIGPNYDRLPPELQAELEKGLDSAKRQALEICIEQTGDGETCALMLDSVGSPDKMRAALELLVQKGAAALCANYGVPPQVCEKVADWALDKAWAWVMGRQYRRPLYRVGMARIITGGPSALSPGEYHIPRSAIRTYQSKIRVGALRFENGAEFHRRQPARESLAVRAELHAISNTTATGESPQIERTIYLPSKNCIAVPVSMGRTWMRDVDGELRKTVEGPKGAGGIEVEGGTERLTGFDVSPIKRLDKGLASFPGWVDLEQ